LPLIITMEMVQRERGCYHVFARATTAIFWLVRRAQRGFPHSGIRAKLRAIRRKF